MLVAITTALLLGAAPKVTVDDLVKKELASSCANQEKPSDYCKLLAGFQKGALPKLPEKRFFSIGPLFTAAGRKDVFVLFISEGAAKKQQAAAETLRPDDEDERKNALAYRASIANKKRDTGSELHEFLTKKVPGYSLHPAKVLDKSLAWETDSSGPNTTWVRQQGDHLIGVALRKKGEAPEVLVFEAPVD
ncbi:MAG: hypothetical protein ACJ790_17955 [Myxococcaceae bacterium]